MTESKKEEDKKDQDKEAKLLYQQAVKLLESKEITLPNDLKESFLNIKKLTDEEQNELISTLSKSEKLPDIIRDLIELIQFKQVPFFDKVPNEVFKRISTYEDSLTLDSLKSLAGSNKKMYTLFNPEKIFTKFLQQVAFGGQDKIEELFKLLIKQKRDKEIQDLLSESGTVTDYSGRTFNCTAYEYAYWAKDRHMCRMLESYMDEDTKEKILKRCEAIEKDGLKYTQNGKESCTKHFDLTPLKTALKEYSDALQTVNWDDNCEDMEIAWMKVGLEQRQVPAHVINEYCRLDRSFDPTPEFNEDKLPRTVTFRNTDTEGHKPLFPLIITENSGLGVDFALITRNARVGGSWELTRAAIWTEIGQPSVDFLAISNLDKVRTEELKQSLDDLKPKELKKPHTGG